MFQLLKCVVTSDPKAIDSTGRKECHCASTKLWKIQMPWNSTFLLVRLRVLYSLGIRFVDKDDLELLTPALRPPLCWDYRRESACLVYVLVGIEPRDSCIPRKYCINWTAPPSLFGFLNFFFNDLKLYKSFVAYRL